MRIPIVFAVLISAVIASAQESRTSSPGETFERAAFAEEHERDFQKAWRLYREAGSVAQFLGDQTLADAAMKALKRVEARMGKGPDTAPSVQAVPAAVQRRLFLLIKDLCAPRDSGEKNLDGKNYEALNQIVPFGAVAVPMLERALNAETILSTDFEPETLHDESVAQLEARIREMRGTFTENWPKLQEALQEHARLVAASRQPAAPSGFRGDSKWAARALARIDLPEAHAALLRGLKSEDPLVRQAIVENVTWDRHRDILDEALKDSNPAIVMAALGRLSRSADPALLPVMRAAIRRNDGGAEAAADWLVNQRPDEAVALMKKPEGLSPEIIRYLVLQYSKVVPAARREDLKGLVELAESLPDPLVAIELFQPLTRGGAGIPDDLKPRVETLALRAMERFRLEDWGGNGFLLLRSAAGIRTAEAFADLLVSGRLPEAGLSRLMLPRYVAEMIEHASPENFVRAVEVVRKISTDFDLEKTSDRGTTDRLFSALRLMGYNGKSVTQEDLLAGYEKLPAGLRDEYLQSVVLNQKDPPAALIRNALRSRTKEIRSRALQRAAQTDDRAFLPDAVAAYSDPEPKVREAAGYVIEGIVRADPGRGEEVVEGLLRTTNPEIVGAFFFGIALALPRPRLIAAAERVWKDAEPERKSALIDLLLGLDGQQENTPELIAFLVSHFDAMNKAEQRQKSIHRFAFALHEPAIELIGKALKDPSPEVRGAAQEALETFRKHREALEEFQRWKTGDAESRASIAELLKLLESPNRDAVIGAVHALAAVKAKSALPALVRLIERNDPEITKAVNEAISKIGE